MHEIDSTGGSGRGRPPFAGLLLIALGALFLAGTLGTIDVGTLIRRWWPLVLVIVGVERLLLAPHHRTGGFTVLAIGAVLLAFTLGAVSWQWIGRFWPVLLIGFGLWLVLRPRR